jgi:hypothetical protein
MASLRSVRSKVVGATVGAAAAGAMALILASPAHAVYGCADLNSGGTACGQSSIPTVPTTAPATTTTTVATTTTLGAVVQGEVVEAAPAAVAPTQVSSDTLPFTGVEVGGLVVLGGGLIAGGVFLSMAARRKGEPQS